MDLSTLTTGLSHQSSCQVDNTNTASALGSGDMDVLATPAMVALMENAAMNAVAAALPTDCATVGIAINVSHQKATPLNETVTAHATLVAIDQKRLTFSVQAFDNQGLIGEGTHIRCVVHRRRFLERAYNNKV